MSKSFKRLERLKRVLELWAQKNQDTQKIQTSPLILGGSKDLKDSKVSKDQKKSSSLWSERLKRGLESSD